MWFLALDIEAETSELHCVLLGIYDCNSYHITKVLTHQIVEWCIPLVCRSDDGQTPQSGLQIPSGSSSSCHPCPISRAVQAEAKMMPPVQVSNLVICMVLTRHPLRTVRGYAGSSSNTFCLYLRTRDYNVDFVGV